MADRFYGYQYDTNPRKINPQYIPYKNRYPQQQEPVYNTRNSRYKAENRDISEKQEKEVPEFGIKQVVNKTKKAGRNVQTAKKICLNDVVRKNNQEEKKSKNNVKIRLKIVLFLIAGFSVLFAISYQNSLISESFNKKEQYKKEMEALIKTNQQLEVNIENSLNLNAIEHAAKEKIGMQKLSNSQKIYVSLDKQDYVAPASEQIIINEDKSLFQKFIDFFN